MILNLGCIVEGQGDVAAVPVLLRRIQSIIGPDLYLEIPQPVRTRRYRFVKRDGRELERAIDLAARKVQHSQSARAILILIDAEDDCPAELGPELLERAKQVRSDIPIGVVLPKFEFESWFLAGAEGIRGQRGLSPDFPAANDPESIRDAKGFLTHHGRASTSHQYAKTPYKPTADQPALAARFDLDRARDRSGSFDKCWREVERLIGIAVENPE